MNERKRHRRKGRRRRRRSPGIALIISIVLVIIIAVAGIFVVWKRYGPSNERADLEQYYGLDSKDEIAVVIDDEVIRREDLAQDEAEGLKVIPAKVYDSEYYIEASVVRDKINERFYWDSNEQILLYTLPSGNVSVVADTNEYTEVNEQKSVDYTILKMEGDKVYIALPFIQTYTNMEYKVYQDPNRIVITADWGEKETAVVKGDTQIRYQGGVKSPVLTDVKKNDKVTVLEDEDDWQKVATADGFIGYLKSSKLKDQKKEKTSRDFAEPEYTSISKDYKINMAWHNVTNVSANQSIQSMLATTKGLTTIAPTWFSLADTEGNITSIADTDYVQYAKQAGLEVWAVLRDFHGGINSYDETYEVLSYSSKRAKVIDQVIAAALQSQVDGINLDFELISSKCGVHYIQFVRELSVKCRENNLVLSVDNYVPKPYNTQYDLKEQAAVADYVFIMAYDEHTDGSNEAGSVASISYLENGVTDALKLVPKEKLVAAIPFFTRLWKETPKTEEELAAEAGTEAADYPNSVSSQALGMDEAAQAVQNAGVTAQWDDETKQNYAKWEADGSTYRIWLEDMQSLEEKMTVIRQNELAGVAEPSSQTFIEVKVAETAMALMEGADEIDIVISVGKFLAGDYEGMCEEIQELKATCKEHHMKVILETGALKTASNIKKASILSMYSGADFIKTSTGKQQPAATPEAALVMCQAIKEYHELTGIKVGFKPAGGINCVNDALIYYTIVKEVLGEEWLNNELFRLGTSRLANLLLSEIKGEEMKFF